jgi:leucyl aminopeptidase
MKNSIRISFAKSPAKSDTAILFLGPEKKLKGAAFELDKKSGGLIAAALSIRENFNGKQGEFLPVILPQGQAFKQVILAGTGESAKADFLSFEKLGGRLLGALKNVSARNVSVFLENLPASLKEEDAAIAIASGLRLRDYSFDKYLGKSRDGKENDAKAISVAIVTPVHAKAGKKYKEYEALAESVHFSRNLVNEAPNVLYPESYAQILKKELEPLGVKLEILDEKKMQKLGFEAHLAVGMGSSRTPRVVVMRWNGLDGKKGGKAPLALVGKGVTFDTGGISIKPAAGMEEMKMDMGGSAAVAGAIRMLATQKAKVNVVGIVGLAENMPSDRSYRPGDIIGSLSGKTIEVLNTDAEGRLILADALTYVQKIFKPSLIIDLATLTGAVMVALGYEYAGAFVNRDDFWQKLEAASKETGEKLWRMPLDEAFRDEMKSSVADLKNLGNQGRYGGACSAAGFLEHFIEKDIPWAHLDIAGTAMWKSDKPITPRGGTGFGVRLLYNFIKAYYS